MSRKTKKSSVRARRPWFFLGLLCAFCVWLTYLYGVFYIPSLPKEEIPPFLLQTEVTEAVTAAPVADTALQVDGTSGQENTEMPADTSSVPADVTAPPSPPASETVAAPTQMTAQTTEAQTSAAAVSRRPGVYNILCAGRDDAAWNTDVLMLVSFDTENGTASVVQIPRDTYLNGGKINALWAKYVAAAKRASSDDPEGDAMERLCSTLENTLCIQIDHWVLCGLGAFREAVDALGGITVDVPCDMDYDDPAQNLSIHLKAGDQRLTGTQAEGLVRFRSGYLRGDLGRVEVQKLVLTAILRELREISLFELPSLVTTATKHLRASLSFSDFLFFAKSAQKLSLSSVTFLTLPGTDCREYGTTGAWYYIVSREGTWEVVNRYLNVYETAVDGMRFDVSYRLTDTEKKALLSYYRTYQTAGAATAQSLDTNGVSVAVIGGTQ
ncbi:MAG: LCP family protein [Clostridia bacterium]|nr:LCP family protein [Clostridia bacterium]